MNVLQLPFASLAICVTLAVATVVAKESLWSLGVVYWLVLGLLALLHVVGSVAVLAANPGRLPLRVGVLVLLFAGQWWLIQMIVMQIVWRFRGFGP